MFLGFEMQRVRAAAAACRRHALPVAAVLWIAVAPVAPARAESLTDALISAYKHSNILDQNRALLRVADEDVALAMAGLRPVVQFISRTGYNSPVTGTGDNWTSTLALNASLTVFDNGVTAFATDAAKETVLGLRAALLELEQRILLGAVQAYMEVIRAAQSVSLAQSNVGLITQELRAARDRFAVGEVTRTDVSIAEARLAASRGNFAAAQGDLAIARETYKAAIGRYPGQLRWPTAPPMAARSEAAAKVLAVRRHPTIDEAQHNVAAAEANIARAQADIGPNATVGATATLIDEGPFTTSANLTINVPIYAGGQLRALKRQAVARADAARAALLQSVVVVRQDVGNTWAQMVVAAARTEASRREVRAAQIAFNGVREEARLGARTTLDVLDAEQDLLDARTNLINAEVQQYVSVYALLAAMGLLTVEHLNLGIVTYDPAAYYNYATEHPLRTISPQGQSLDRVLKYLGKN